MKLFLNKLVKQKKRNPNMSTKTNEMSVDIDLYEQLKKMREGSKLNSLELQLQAIQSQNQRHAIFVAAVRDARKSKIVIRKGR